MPKIRYYSQIKKELAKKLLKWVKKWILLLSEEINANTPEKSKTLLGNNKVEDAKQIGDMIIAKVSNDTPYAGYVEYWVMWWWYNFHKPAWSIFYTAPAWEWAWMFRRSTDKKKWEILKIIEKSVNE